MGSTLPAADVGTAMRRVRVTRGVTYGHAAVGYTGPGRTRQRVLLMDVYQPVEAQAAPTRSGLMLAFGGAFHRGDRQDDRITEGTDQANTSIADYCALMAQQGHVCFSIDYRLVTEDPDPGATAVVADPELIPRSRVDHVRELMGLPPATSEMLWRGIEAAADDMATAFRFVQAQAATWRLDPRRLVLGGFSAGARTAFNAVLGEGVPAAGLISLSGYIDADDLQRHLARHPRPGLPVLMINGEHDLDYIQSASVPMARTLREAQWPCEHRVVPSCGHFYPASATADLQATHTQSSQVDAASPAATCSVQAAMAAFMARTVGATKA